MENIHIALRVALEAVQGNPVISGLTVLVLWALIQDLFLFRRLRRLVRGGDGKTLEGTIRTLQERVIALEEHARKSNILFTELNIRVSKSIRGVSVKKFDPFEGNGGQQSFVVAFVDEKGSGAVISGIHARDGVRVYAKAVEKFSSDRALSEEEKTAVLDARQNISNT